MFVWSSEHTYIYAYCAWTPIYRIERVEVPFSFCGGFAGLKFAARSRCRRLFSSLYWTVATSLLVNVSQRVVLIVLQHNFGGQLERNIFELPADLNTPTLALYILVPDRPAPETAIRFKRNHQLNSSFVFVNQPFLCDRGPSL